MRKVLFSIDEPLTFDDLYSNTDVKLSIYFLIFSPALFFRSVWQCQSKKLPRYDDNLWMSTFLSPLYSHNAIGFCDKVYSEAYSVVRGDDSSLRFRTKTYNLFPQLMCAACYVKKVIELTKCIRCMKVSYRSLACEQKKWMDHRKYCLS